MEQLARTIAAKKAVSEALPAQAETAALQRLSRDADAMAAALDALEAAACAARDTADVTARANAFHDAVLPAMAALRAAADDAETVCGAACWPLPSYSSMLHYVIE